MPYESNGDITYSDGGISNTVLDVYSREIEFHAQPVLRFREFAEEKTDLTTQPGTTIKMTTYDNLDEGGTLKEDEAMETQDLNTTQKEIKVEEYGNAVAVSEMTLQASFDDTLASAAELLGKDYAKVIDRELRDTVLGTSNVVYGGQKDSQSELTENDTIDSAVLKDAVETLATNDAPKYENDFYVTFVHPHHARDIRDDAEFQNVTAYGRQYAGEIGRIHDVIFVETTNMPMISEDDGDNDADIDLYDAVMFGDNAFALAWALPVEMRDNGVEDFGRIHKLAWYSIFGTGILEEDNIVKIQTA